MSDVDMTVEFSGLTKPQALALKRFFKEWTYAGMGRTRQISFMVDGDGNFLPSIETEIHGEVPEVSKEVLNKAKVSEEGIRIDFDFDPIAWEVET